MTTLENRPNAALLVIDVQNAALERAHERDAVIANVGSLVERARREGVPVVWVQHFDEHLARESDGWQIVSELTRGEAEPLVEKSHGDSFEDTTLETVLSGLGVGRLVVVGAQTDWCVRSTLHGAFVRGYDATLVGDAHTTEDQTESGAPPPDKVIAHTNLYWAYQTGPGRTAGTVNAEDVDFRGPSEAAGPWRSVGACAAAASMRRTASSMRASRVSISIHSDGVWSSPPTGPRPSIVGMPSAPVQHPSETPSGVLLADVEAELRRERARQVDEPRSPRHRRPGAAILDLAGHAVVGPVALELREREDQIAGDARADVDRGERLARDGVHRVAPADRRDHRRHLGAAGGERLDAEDLLREGRDGAPAAVSVGPRMRGPAVQPERAPDRALPLRHQVAVLACALEHQRGRSALRLVAHGGRSQACLLVGTHEQAHLREGPAGRRGQALDRGRCEEHAALHVGHAGAEAAIALAPERAGGGGPDRKHGVGVAEQRDHRPAVARERDHHAARGAVGLARPTGRCTRPAPATRRPARRSTPAPSRQTASRGSRAARAGRRSARRRQKP